MPKSGLALRLSGTVGHAWLVSLHGSRKHIAQISALIPGLFAFSLLRFIRLTAPVRAAVNFQTATEIKSASQRCAWDAVQRSVWLCGWIKPACPPSVTIARHLSYPQLSSVWRLDKLACAGGYHLSTAIEPPASCVFAFVVYDNTSCAHWILKKKKINKLWTKLSGSFHLAQKCKCSLIKPRPYGILTHATLKGEMPGRYQEFWKVSVLCLQSAWLCDGVLVFCLIWCKRVCSPWSTEAYGQ